MANLISLHDMSRTTKMPLKRHSIMASPKSKLDIEHPGFLCFTLDGREFGVDLNVVSEIVKPPPLTWVPLTEPYVLGIVSIRGAVMSLLDLRQLMCLQPTSWPRSSRVLIVENESERIGLLVDSITSVRRVQEGDLESSASLDVGVLIDYVICLFRPLPTSVVVVIDLDALLSEKVK